MSLAARPIEAAEFAARAYLNERLHNGTQKLVVFEVDVNANTVALDKSETDNPSTEWAVRHPEQTGPYYRCDTDLPAGALPAGCFFSSFPRRTGGILSTSASN